MPGQSAESIPSTSGWAAGAGIDGPREGGVSGIRPSLLERVLPAECAGNFEYVGAWPALDGRLVHRYRHRITGADLNLDSAGAAYRHEGSGFSRIRLEAAFAEVFANFGEADGDHAAGTPAA